MPGNKKKNELSEKELDSIAGGLPPVADRSLPCDNKKTRNSSDDTAAVAKTPEVKAPDRVSNVDS